MSSTSLVYPGAIIPSDILCEMVCAVVWSHGAARAIKLPMEDMQSTPDRLCFSELYEELMRNVPQAVAYMEASGVKGSLISSTLYSCFPISVSLMPTAAPAGEMCLKEVVA